jgi:hypothetical protein
MLDALDPIFGSPDHQSRHLNRAQSLANACHVPPTCASRVPPQVAADRGIAAQRPQPPIDQVVGQWPFGQPAEGHRKPAQGSDSHEVCDTEKPAWKEGGEP